MPISRRNLILGALGAVGLTTLLAACASDEEAAPPRDAGTGTAGSAGATTLAATPTCDDGDEPTPAQTEGPYFTSGSPRTADLAAGVDGGTPLSLAGTVLTTGCVPVKAAKLDFWQTDADGEYDNRGYRLRGHVLTDDEGRYQVSTIVPGLYPGRTRHIHVTAQAPSGQVLTTQLYFPGEPANARDGIYRKECEVTMADGPSGGKQASFTFVLA